MINNNYGTVINVMPNPSYHNHGGPESPSSGFSGCRRGDNVAFNSRSGQQFQNMERLLGMLMGMMTGAQHHDHHRHHGHGHHRPSPFPLHHQLGPAVERDVVPATQQPESNPRAQESSPLPSPPSLPGLPPLPTGDIGRDLDRVGDLLGGLFG